MYISSARQIHGTSRDRDSHKRKEGIKEEGKAKTTNNPLFNQISN
jgi:hypothetical protein